MAAQSRASTMLEFVVLVVLGLLSMNAVSAVIQFQVQWGTPPTLHLGELHQNQTLEVGDVLHFVYNNMTDDLLEVTPEHFTQCDNSAPLNKWTDGNSIVTLSKPGTLHFICGFPGHCEAGEILSVNVGKIQPQGMMVPAPSHSIEALSQSEEAPSTKSETKTKPKSEELTPSEEASLTKSGSEALTPSEKSKSEALASSAEAPSAIVSAPTTHTNAISPTTHTNTPSASPATHTEAHSSGKQGKQSSETVQRATLKLTWCLVALACTLWINKVVS